MHFCLFQELIKLSRRTTQVNILSIFYASNTDVTDYVDYLDFMEIVLKKFVKLDCQKKLIFVVVAVVMLNFKN